MRCDSFWIIFLITIAAAPHNAATAQSADQIARPIASARLETTAIIQGSAVGPQAGDVGAHPVRLRDARSGHLAGRSLTDKAGAFEFRGIDPGSYVVELMGADDTVIAASDIISVNAGERVSMVLNLTATRLPLSGVLGRSIGSALLITTAAATAGILATQVTGEPVSPRQ